MLPRVSVVIPTYNRPIFLQRAVRSVLAQTFTDWELIVVNDGSEVAYPPLPDDPRIRYEEHAVNKGLSATRNTGIIAARGEYIAFLDDDDEWLPTKLEKQVAFMDGLGPEVGLTYTWHVYISSIDGRELNKWTELVAGDIFEKALAMYIPSIPSTGMVRSEVFVRVGGFDESIRAHEDHDFLCRLAKLYLVEALGEVLCRYYIGHSQITEESRIARSQRDYLRWHIRRFSCDFQANPRAELAVLKLLLATEYQLGVGGQAVWALWRILLRDPGYSLHLARFVAKKWLGRLE